MDKLLIRTNLFPAFSRLKWGAYKYKWTEQCEEALPEHYKLRCLDYMLREPTPVHWIPEPGKWTFDPISEERTPVQNHPIEVTYPEECNTGLWGGEGIVMGYTKKDKRFAKALPGLWPPTLMKRALYSEILDKWITFVVTERTLDLVDEAMGFDHYILKTHERDLNSKLGVDFKRFLLVKLAKKSLYPNDREKQQKVYDRYKQYVIPLEEAEWVGLSIAEAMRKARNLKAKQNPVKPKKFDFAEEFIDKLQENPDLLAQLEVVRMESQVVKKSMLDKINPFKRGK